MNNIRARGLVFAVFICLLIFTAGCDTSTTPNATTNENSTNLTNDNAGNSMDNAGQTNTNNASEDVSGSAIDSQVSEEYQARVNLKFEALGENNNASLPSLGAVVARDAGNKRMEFNLPNGQKIVYLELGTKNLVILPDKKQYAELNKDAVGFEVRSLMTPEQIMQRAKSIKGLEKVGEEKYKGRDAVKYRYSATTDTQTKAGEVDTESFVYVDKETGLPLKTDFVSKAKDGNVQGFQGMKIVTEMSDIKTEVPADMFAEPEGFEKIEEEQIRNQINLIFNTVAAVLNQMMQNAAAN
jgi:hypothetical protein